MAAQLNNKEKEVYRQVIKEMIQECPNVASLKIVFYLRSLYDQRRHHQTIQRRFVERMKKIIEENDSIAK